MDARGGEVRESVSVRFALSECGCHCLVWPAYCMYMGYETDCSCCGLIFVFQEYNLQHSQDDTSETG